MSYFIRHILFLALFSCLAQAQLSAADWTWQTDGRVIAMSDIHGADEAFLSVVQGLELVDEAGHWSGGKDHLVIVGDILDRGAASRDVLEMVVRLEGEAEEAGGRVHLLLGNHEIMNLVGDLRYVAVEEFARYAEIEDTDVRKAALEEYVRLRKAGDMGAAALKEAFDKAHPPGFFAHQAMFSSKGKLGSWLLGRPVVIKVNDSVFVHGGLSPAVSGKSLDDINTTHQDALRIFTENRDYFIENNILEFGTNFYDQASRVKKILQLRAETKPLSSEEESRVKQFFSAYKSEIFDDASPTWYRGNVGCSAAVERDRLRGVLSELGAKRIVIGHTPTATRGIESRFDEMIVRVDTGMLSSHYRGRPSAVVISDGSVETYYPDSDVKTTTITPRRVGPRADGLTDEQLEQVFTSAPLSASEKRKQGGKQVKLANGDTQVATLFSKAAAIKGGVAVLPEVAAYRLDRYLGTDFIPVAMAREVDGKAGSLSLDLDSLIDENQRIARQLGGGWCPLQDQFNMMYLFDLLVHNKGRKPEAMRYISGNMNLVLTDNAALLGTQKGAPRYLKSVQLTIPADVRQLLTGLDEALLEEMLGDVLDQKRQKALLARRDRVLKQAK